MKIKISYPELESIYNNDNELKFEELEIKSKICKWNCLKCNSVYENSVADLIRGRRCPYCSGKKVNNTNSLQSLYPLIAKLWSYENELRADQVNYGSGKKALFTCDKCKQVHSSIIKDKVKSPGCPFCSGHRASKINNISKNKEIMEFWDFDKNENPENYTSSSNKKVWWKCELGHSYLTSIKSKVNGHGCTFCKGNSKVLKGYNDLNTTNPYLASLVYNEEDKYRFSEFSSKSIDFKCPKCENKIQNKTIRDVSLYGLSCDDCSDKKSYGEKLMYCILSYLNLDFKFDKKLEWSNNKRYDFIIDNLNLIIEVHGRQHYGKGFESIGGKTLKEEQINDSIKKDLALNNGFVNYIVIDARNSNFNFIKNNILNSELNKLLDLHLINWEDIIFNFNK